MTFGPEIFQPETVEEAVALLAEDEGARPLSGGATLVAMMNARLVEPSRLVSLDRIAELKEFRRNDDGSIRVGAMRRHRETAFESALTGTHAVLSSAAARIANPPVRNMGTIGGSISFADPAADYPPALVAADAHVEIAGPTGRREIPAEDFFLGWYETALQPGEIVTAVLLPSPLPDGIGHYEKLCRVAGDFALASVAVAGRFGPGGAIEAVRIAVGGCGGGPVRDPAAEILLMEKGLSGLDEAGASLCGHLDPVDDVRGSAAYRLTVVPRLLAKALTQAISEGGMAA